MDTASQSEVVAFLADPASHGGAAVERIDTHISSLFLTGSSVFKLKKAVRLPFLDFSTLAARKAACDAELAINRAATPGLYVGLRVVTRDGDRLRFDGDGTVLDWVVEMHRFDQADRFDLLLAAGRIDRDLIYALTEAIAAFHRTQPARPDKGDAAALAWVIATNRATMLAQVPDIFAAAAVDELAEASTAALARLTPVLEARRKTGKVRWCHGDLHLGNLCLFEGRPALFDALEFSEDLACIDVFYDLAFLLMDLDHRGARRMASWVMNHYLDLTGDYQGLEPLPLFLSSRAAIRAHVCATMAATQAGEARNRLAEEARTYLAQAAAYLSPPPARLLAVGGLSGSGKSRMARELSPYLGIPGAAVVRTDSLRKQLMGVGIHDRLGPEGYTAEVTERTYDALYDTVTRLLAAGHAVVADAVFARPEQRAAIADIARAAAVRFDGVWLDTPPDLAAARIRTRRANISDATPEVLDRQRAYDLGPITWIRIDSSPPKDITLAAGRAALGV